MGPTVHEVHFAVLLLPVVVIIANLASVVNVVNKCLHNVEHCPSEIYGVYTNVYIKAHHNVL